ncbi:MAG: hypothetical protein QOK19_1200 [Solirubrobacteraceae bacterium]|jgi:hypothetical protein|nr:hypothetical protein [Solirubrobacteraceae bacterium]
MEPTTDNLPPDGSAEPPGPVRLAPVRIPSRRWTAALAAAMLGIGVAAGAAIGPAPAASLAGDIPSLAKELPLLIAGLEAKHRASTATAPAKAATPSPAVTPEPSPAPAPVKAATPASATTPAASEEASPTETTTKPAATKKLPAITNVWLIELAGPTFTAALAQKAAAPYINGSLVPAGTLLGSWSAVDATAFAAEATLAEPPVAGAVPPLLHSIVQPPCPEGAAGAACAPETPSQLTAADEFLKTTLASITSLSTYKEHGLIVITFATVGIATQSELPAGASTSTLAYQPPAGVALLSPFAKAGAHPSSAFNPTSPRQSLEKLLH